MKDKRLTHPKSIKPAQGGRSLQGEGEDDRLAGTGEAMNTCVCRGQEELA